MAVKRNPENENEFVEESSISSQKAKQLFANETRKPKEEKKTLRTFATEASFKRELEDLFSSMGLGWAAGIRFSPKEFPKKHGQD